MTRRFTRLAGASMLCCAALAAQATTAAAEDWASGVFGGNPGTGFAGRGEQESGKQLTGADRRKARRSRPSRLASADPDAPSDEPKATKPVNIHPKPILPRGRGKWQWRILRTDWNEKDEKAFAQFVTAIGESDCSTVHDCITSPKANPQFHATNSPHLKFYSDCADLPYFLRAYFAFKTGLPFSFSVRYAAHPRLPGSTEKVHGNQIADRYDIVGPGPDGRIAVATVGRFVSTEHFRIPPGYAGKLLPDYYPVALTRQSIKPGTVIFDPDGHIAVVYKVTDNGRIHYIDAHPDNSLTRGVYARDFARADPQMGAGFKRWRPQRLVGAKKAADGTWNGGRIELKPDKELADWSDEQFYGNTGKRPKAWRDGKFLVDGNPVDYYDYLRIRLAHPGFRYDPLDEIRESIRGLCDDFRYRSIAVENAVRAKYHLRSQPPRLPNNIYATRGDWETYSTPSRDARLKVSFEELRDDAARFLKMYADKSQLLRYAGSDLRQDMLHVYETETRACSITYTRSDGSKQTLGFEDVRKRLFDLSFDPHHCAERRWGATDADELATCTDDALKKEWYAAQNRLRNQVTRTYGEVMGWTLAQLKNQQLDIGNEEAPDVDTLKVLNEGIDVALASDMVTDVD